MNESLKRRSLLAVAPPLSSPFADEAIAGVSTRDGFPAAESRRAVTAPVVADSASRRRQRHPTGREHQFNVRLRQETLDFIYREANERDIPIAQVIEEMVETLKREQRKKVA